MRFSISKNLFLGLGLFLNSWVNTSAQQTQFWGLIENGGNGFGAIVSTDENGDNYQVEHYFGENSLSNARYTEFLEVGNLNFYGVTWGHGAHGLGGLFEYDHNSGKVRVLHNFDYENGKLPGPVIHLNQKLYGLTHRQPGVNYGVLYEYDLQSGQFTHKVDFDTNNTGSVFSDGLCLASNGKFYGVAGGFLKNYSRGYIFEYDPVSDTYKKLFNFNDTATSGVVLGHLIQATNGKLYGMSYAGGMYDEGVIFEYDITGNQYTALHHFNDTNGGKPYLNSLIEFGDGQLYGMTNRAGNFDEGVMFRFDIDSMKFHLIHHFTDGNDGAQPYGNLTAHVDGKLYGFTTEGGLNGHGVIFSYDTSNQIMQQIFHFDDNNTGRNPDGSLCSASDGQLYGVAPLGSQKLFGNIFQFQTTTKNFSILNYFNDRSSGANPQGQLLHHSNGRLYGTAKGGSSENGIIFSIDPVNKDFLVEHNFSWKKGQSPTGFISEASNGDIYGISEYGGNDSIFGFGVIYKFNPNTKVLDTILSLKENVHGRNSTSGWVKGSGELLYVSVDFGGLNGGGCLLSLNPVNDEVKVLHSFSTHSGNLYRPASPLIPYKDGRLFGLLAQGGLDDIGGIFKFDPSDGSMEIVHEFTSNQSGLKSSYICRGPDNLIYGALSQENGNYGSIYSFNPDNETFSTLFENTDPENGILGSFNKMLWASNDKLYGFTFQSGLYDQGTFYEFDPKLEDFTKKLDFSGVNGSKPFNSLIEINGDYNQVTEEEFEKFDFIMYPNPAQDQLNFQFDFPTNPVRGRIVDQYGREIIVLNENDLKNSPINVSDLANGLYILELWWSEHSARNTFIIDR